MHSSKSVHRNTLDDEFEIASIAVQASVLVVSFVGLAGSTNHAVSCKTSPPCTGGTTRKNRRLDRIDIKVAYTRSSPWCRTPMRNGPARIVS